MTLHDPQNRIDTDSPLMESRLTGADQIGRAVV